VLKVLLASPEGEAYFDLLNDLPDVEFVRCRTTAEAMTVCEEIDVFYGRPTDELLAAAPNLRWIQASSAGVDFLLSTPNLVESEIPVTNTRGAHGPSIAEHVFAMLLTMTRGIPQATEWKAQKYWGRVEAYRTQREIKDSTMGIVGYGAIGRNVAKRARAFDLEVLAVDARPGPGDDAVTEVWSVSRLHEMLGRADVVVIAAPYTRETHHLIAAAAIAAMQPDAYLIAVSRGGIVDEAALVEAMRAGHLAGAGLDVTEKEPLPADSPLWEIPNLILTPHSAGASGAKERRVVEVFRENLIRFAKGDELMNLVDKRAGY
jgi:phosphoglycerate dehydrogenase-like enzyme